MTTSNTTAPQQQPAVPPGTPAPTSPSITALLVSDDSGLMGEVGGWLEASGAEVLTCPGPQSNGATCIGLTDRGCPLARAADVAIIDMHPNGGDLVASSDQASLAAYYRGQGCAVIGLLDVGSWLLQPDLAGTAILNRFVGRSELLEAVSEITSHSTNQGD